MPKAHATGTGYLFLPATEGCSNVAHSKHARTHCSLHFVKEFVTTARIRCECKIRLAAGTRPLSDGWPVICQCIPHPGFCGILKRDSMYF